MYPHVFSAAYGFNRTEHHLIIEGAFVTIWKWYFQTSGLGVLVLSLGLLDDFSSLDFFLWYVMKSFVYETPINFEMNLVAQTSVATDAIREKPGIFEHVHQSMLLRCRESMHASGRNFKHLLKCFYVILFIYFLYNKTLYTTFCVVS